MFGDAYQASEENNELSGYSFVEAAKGYDGPPQMMSLYVGTRGEGPEVPEDQLYLPVEIMSPSIPAAKRFKSWLRRRHEQLLAA
jgi:hypothetical protein